MHGSFLPFEKIIQKKKSKLFVTGFNNWLVFGLFFWFVSFTYFNTRIPFYDKIEDLIFLTFLIFILAKSCLIQNLILPFNTKWLFSFVGVTVLSAIFNNSSRIGVLKFYFIISRPLILFTFLASFNIPSEKILNKIIFWSRVLIFCNLPAIIYRLCYFNIGILEHPDAIVGFPPFTNNDSLIILYSVVFFKDFYDFVFRMQRKRILLLLFEMVLIISTVNMRTILAIILIIIWVIVSKLRKKILYLMFFGALAVLIVCFFYSIIYHYYTAIMSSTPTIVVYRYIIQENSSFLRILIGAGPANFTSPVALDSKAPLAVKYIQPLAEYIEALPTSGALTRASSSVTTLLGETGLLGILSYSFLLFGVIKRLEGKITWSYQSFMGYAFFGMMMVFGFILNSWFWGANMFLTMLCTHASIRIQRETIKRLV